MHSIVRKSLHFRKHEGTMKIRQLFSDWKEVIIVNFPVIRTEDYFFMWKEWIKIYKKMLEQARNEPDTATPERILNLENQAQIELIGAYFEKHHIPLGGDTEGMDSDADQAAQVVAKIAAVFRDTLEKDPALEQEIIREEKEIHHLLPEVRARLMNELDKRVSLS